MNLGSEPGYGSLMLVEAIKEFCKKGYSSFDTGISGVYGNYKSAIFLDRIETERKTIPFL